MPMMFLKSQLPNILKIWTALTGCTLRAHRFNYKYQWAREVKNERVSLAIWALLLKHPVLRYFR